MRGARRLLGLVLVMTTLAAPLAARSASPLLLGDGPAVADREWQVTTFAAELPFPMGMVALPDESLLVGTSVPAGGYFSSEGQVLRLVDADGDGVADDGGTVVAAGLPGAVVAVARADRLLFVTSAESGRERISVLRQDGDWTEPWRLLGSIDFAFIDFDHQSYGLATRPIEGDRYELFFNIGAAGNNTAGGIVDASGLVSATLEDASIYRVVVEDPSDTGDVPIVSAPEAIATGLRNASAFTFDPATGDLLVADNGIDTPANRIVALSADEVNVIPAAAIGGEVEDFGFPDAYIVYRSGKVKGDRGIDPAVAFTPIEGSENEGTSAIVAAPPGFPDGLNAGVFVGFHGQWDDAGIANEENPVVYADPATGEMIVFVSNDDPVLGHADSLLASADTLYVADLCGAGGSLAGAAPCGTIYAIRPAAS